MGSIVNLKNRRTSPPVTTAAEPNLANKNIHILVVEDEELFRDAVYKTLIEDGYQVSQVGSAEEARLILDTKVVDLIVLDLMLPGRDGFDFIVDLRSSPKTKHIPIIVVSARDTISHRVKGLDLGAGDYMTKPISLVELKARIRALLRQSKAPPVILQFSKLRLEKARSATFLQDESGTWNPVLLTQREFDILWFLAESKDVPKTRAEILGITEHPQGEHLGGADREEFVMENTIDVHIHNIRRKIGPRWIRTVFRIGFMFVDPYE